MARAIIEISTQQLYELYLDTLRRCSRELLQGSDDELEYNLWEEFDTGATSFLHADSLSRLRKAGLIGEDAVHLSQAVRTAWFDLQREDWSLDQVRTRPEWQSCSACPINCSRG